MFHTDILTKEQKKLLPLVQLFRKHYYLVGGTAIALQIGHRFSVDFDLFTVKPVQRRKIPALIKKSGFSIDKIIHEDVGELHVEVNGVKMTFFNFEYPVIPTIDFDGIIKIPDLLNLAAMKAFAFAERVKWKDYVDMYFILKNNFSLARISQRAEEMFNNPKSIIFSRKLFQQQLCYFQNIKFEKIDYLRTPVPDEEIKNFLIDVATQPF